MLPGLGGAARQQSLVCAEAAANNTKSSRGGDGQRARLGSHAVAGRQQRYTQLLNRALQDSGEAQVRPSPSDAFLVGPSASASHSATSQPGFGFFVASVRL